MTRVPLAIIAMLVLINSGVRAEIFLSSHARPTSSIIVYDNFDAGLDVPPKRVISGPDTGLLDPYAVEVYTGSTEGSEAEIFVCEFQGNADSRILVFPITAQGNQPPLRTLPLNENCARIALYGDELFIPQGGNGFGPPMSISVWDHLAEGPAAVPDRKIAWDPAGDLEDTIIGVDVSEDEIFVLVNRANQKDALDRNLAEIWVFDVNAAGIAQEEVRRVIAGHPSLVNGYNLLVSHGEILVTTVFNEQPGNALSHNALFFDAKASGLAAPFRTLNSEESFNGAARLGDELFFLGFPINNGEGAVWVYDARSSGVAREKRALADVQGQWGIFESVFVTPDREPESAVFELSLEEPVNSAVHSGVGNLRGWAVASDGVARIELFVDGELYQDAPYGGNRADVANVFPEVPGAFQSGFSLAFNYGALEEGTHTIEAVAHTVGGKTRKATASFSTVRPGREFVRAGEGVDLAEAACSIDGDAIQLEGLIIDGDERWGAVLNWQKASQGFETQEYTLEQ